MAGKRLWSALARRLRGRPVPDPLRPRTPLRDHLRETHLFTTRAVGALVVILLLTAVLLGRLIYLQVLAHEHYATLSDKNRVDLVPVPPTRGLIYDRHGVLLAQNVPAFSLEVVPEQAGDLEATLAALGRVVRLTEADLERFRQRLARRRPFAAIPLRLRLSEEEVARFAVERHRFPGVDIRARLMRSYPLGPLTVRAVGYVGRISEAELARLDEAAYQGTSHVGKAGVEKYYETLLHGRVGYDQVETNALGRVLRVLARKPPVPGEDLYLTIDVALQRTAQEALAGRRGAVVAIDPRNGEVLALVSTPAYDPNLFVGGIDPEAYRALSEDPDKPLFDRALQGNYPPGSTLKPFLGLAGLVHGVVTAATRVYCPGWYVLEGSQRRYRDWKRTGHGSMDLRRAMLHSCDVYFYDLAHNLGIDRMSAFLARFGFGRPTGVDLPGEASGLLPSRAWKRRVKGEPWFPGETLIAGIGQGYLLATPLQLAQATAVLASRGLVHRPRLLRATRRPGGALAVLDPEPAGRVTGVAEAHWRQVIASMEAVIRSPRGTAHGLAEGLRYRMAGKTGTAQVFGLPQDEQYRYKPEEIAERLRDHALFVAFAPVERPRIAVAVVVENGGSGGRVAGPVARAVIDRHLEREGLLPVPGRARGEGP